MIDERQKLEQWRTEAHKNGLSGSELIAWETEKLCREVAEVKRELKRQRLEVSPPLEGTKKQILK